MLRSLTTLKNGIERSMDTHDVYANNMANINTVGFKQSKVMFKDIREVEIQKYQNKPNEYDPTNPPVPAGRLSLGPEVAKMVVDFSQGDFITTNNKLDFAIHGGGFFAVKGADNQEVYTRKGNFTLDSKGYLTTSDGQKVLNRSNGPIKIDVSVKAEQIIVQKDGLINYGREKLGYMKIVDFADKTGLTQVQGNAFASNGATPTIMSNPDILQGALEGSNANAVETMLKSIEASRSYESMAAVMQTTSDTLQKVINQTGRF